MNRLKYLFLLTFSTNLLSDEFKYRFDWFSLPVADLMKAMTSDKKVVAGNLRFVLMREIGDSHVVSDVESSEVEGIWKSVGAD